MLQLELERRDIDLTKYKDRSAVVGDYDRFIDEECLIYEHGSVVIAYMTPADPDGLLSQAKRACQEVRYETTYRTSGLKTTSRIFGYEPRKVMRKDFCSSTALAREAPAQHNAILRAGSLVAKEYQRANPELYERHCQMSDDNVKEDYKIEGVPFTSGIINRNNPLKYHFDSGNYKNVWSGMICFKTSVDGGFLSCPEFGIGIALRDNSFLFFDGQGILHGVTPFTKWSEDGERHSIVYYSLQQMWNCLPIDDEIARIKTKRTEREDKRLRGISPVGD